MGEDAKSRLGDDLVTLDQASRHLAEAHLAKQDWSGLPVPVPGLSLVLEPRYKHKCLEEFRWKECFDENGVRHVMPEDPQPSPSEFTRVNGMQRINSTRLCFTTRRVGRVSVSQPTTDSPSLCAPWRQRWSGRWKPN